MNLPAIALRRHAVKAYDASKTLEAERVEELLALLRLSPSSVNSQPWHFVVAGSAEGKARVAKAAQGPYAYNLPKIANASHVIVLCVRTAMPDEHLQALLDREQHDGRFKDAEARAGQHKTRLSYVDLHRQQLDDLRPWMEKQVYLALGTLLLGAAAAGIDATPMEGFDIVALDAELGLAEQGYSSLVLVSLGYRSEQDFNARLPKSRLSAEQVFTRL